MTTMKTPVVPRKGLSSFSPGTLYRSPNTMMLGVMISWVDHEATSFSTLLIMTPRVCGDSFSVEVLRP